MNKCLMIAALCVSGTVFAAEPSPNEFCAAKQADPRSNVGIGLGTYIFDGQEGLISQVCAATTNASFGTQTFAITTGTSGAKKWDKLAMNDEVRNYVKDNLDTLARDMARGKGESLNTLAELLGVKESDRVAFAKDLQKEFLRVYSSSKVNHVQVVENLGARA